MFTSTLLEEKTTKQCINGQKKRDKTTNDYIQNITQKIKHRAIKKPTKTLGFKKKTTQDITFPR
jgi:hypothetical protein